MSARVFSYGSNLCVERLRARTPSARALAVGTVAGHALRWHKAAVDGSGKCDAFATGDPRDLVWGVVYELDAEDKLVLDGFEGLGHDYFEKRVEVRGRSGAPIDATAYVANPTLLDESVRPWCWYKGFVVTGARQHALPADYVARLEAVEHLADPDPARRAREEAVLSTARLALRA